MPSNNSTTKTYYVYTLTNPIDDQVFYVGLTTNPKVRINGHTSLAKKSNPKKIAIIRAILDAKCRPVLTIIDTFNTDRYDYALRIETLWVIEMTYRGVDLVNDPHQHRLRIKPTRSMASEIELQKTIAQMTPDERVEYLTRNNGVTILDWFWRYYSP